MSRVSEQDYQQGRARRQSGALLGALRLLGRWSAFRRRLSSRRALLRLSEEQLNDIGLSRAQALVEAERPFWTLWR